MQKAEEDLAQNEATERSAKRRKVEKVVEKPSDVLARLDDLLKKIELYPKKNSK
jgi:hypothetical protein